MGIDFSQLDNLFKCDLSHVKEYGNSKTPKDRVNSLKNDLKGNTRDTREISTSTKQYFLINKEKEALERANKIYETYQDNIKKSEMLISDILNDIKLGQNPYNLLLKAIECISLMTGNPYYYNQSKDDLQAIYGALGYKTPVEQEAQEVQERLKNLIKALDRETDTNNKERIKKAIKAHKERQDQLLKLIS